MGASRLHRLAEYGQSVWIDFLSRDMIRNGELERRMRDDGVVGVTSNPTIFLSRVDTETDRRLDEIGGHDELKGKLAIANAKLAYQRYNEIFAGGRWEALSSSGATTQRCLWASTSTKNPAYRDVMYVEELIGPKTVNT